MRLAWAMIVSLMATLTGCRDDQDPGGASAMWDRIHAENYRGWHRAPGYARRTQSLTSHAETVDIYVNPVVQAALDEAKPLREWPQGSMIVKDGFSGDDRVLLAVMEKRPDGWWWVEYDEDGDPLASGHPAVCIDCHSRSAFDHTWSFGLP